jgi:hypothetical protein
LSLLLFITTISATHLVEEDILPVVALEVEGAQRAVGLDAVLRAQLLPELRADCSIIAIARAVRSEANRGGISKGFRQHRQQQGDSLWLPHWPACKVMISLGIYLL